MKSKETASLGSVPLLITEVVFLALAVVAVLFRFLSLLCVKNSLGWDDFWIVAALVFFWVHQSLQLGSLAIVRSPHPDMLFWTKLEYISALFCNPSALCVKISLLCLYRRLFPIPWVRWATSIMMGVCVVWAVTFWFPLVLMCTPPESLWNPAVRGQCIESGKAQVVAFTTELAIDTIILSLPIRMVTALQLAPRRKFLVLMIFLLGGLVIITNIVRIKYAYDNRMRFGITWQEEMLFSIHNGTATLCACLPTYGHLVKRVARFVSRVGKRYGFSQPSSLQRLDDAKLQRTDPGSGTSKVELHLSYQKSWESEDQNVHQVDFQSGESATDTLRGYDEQHNVIEVESTVAVC